jgi:hypothetical protein
VSRSIRRHFPSTLLAPGCTGTICNKAGSGDLHAGCSAITDSCQASLRLNYANAGCKGKRLFDMRKKKDNITANRIQWLSRLTQSALASLSLLTSLRLANATLLARLSRVSLLPARIFAARDDAVWNQDLGLAHDGEFDPWSRFCRKARRGCMTVIQHSGLT